MRRALRITAIALGSGAALLALLALAARWADGPLSMLPGGPLRSGEWIEDPDIDWSFAADLREIELQSGGRSRTVWLFVREGELYVPASVSFPPFKRWHLEALDDPRAIVRIQGRRYRRTLRRIEDPAVIEPIRALALEKYGVSADPRSVWLFRLDPAPTDADSTPPPPMPSPPEPAAAPGASARRPSRIG